MLWSLIYRMAAFCGPHHRWATGLLFHAFAIAGGLTDLSAATSIAAVVDPTRGEQGAVFNRLFSINLGA